MKKKQKPTVSDVVEVILKVKRVDKLAFHDLNYLIMTYDTFGVEDRVGYDKEIEKDLSKLLKKRIITEADTKVIWDYLKLPDDVSDSGYIAFRFSEAD